MFEFRTQGHFGNSITKENFSLKRDTIILKPYSKEKQTDKSFYFKNMDTLLVTDFTTLTSITGKYRYCRIADGVCCNDDPK